MPDRPRERVSDKDLVLLLMEGDEDALRALVEQDGLKIAASLCMRFRDVVSEDAVESAVNAAALGVAADQRRLILGQGIVFGQRSIVGGQLLLERSRRALPSG